MGLQLRSGNVPREVAWFSTAEEGTAKSQKDQDRVNSVFSIGKVLSIMSMTLQVKQLIKRTASMFFNG